MKIKNLVVILTLVLLAAFTACDNSKSASSSAVVETEVDSVALSLGYSIGANLKEQFPDVNAALIAEGIVKSFDGEANPLFASEQEADMAIRAYLQEESVRQAQANVEKGEAFLAENAKRDGVMVTESGLQYEVLTEGDGPKPTAENTVKVHYHGTTIDGEVFDSSVDRGEPAQFPLNGVIPGWTEGVQLMSVGSKYKLYVPADLAYGERGAGGMIGPNSTLVFEVELLEIVE